MKAMKSEELEEELKSMLKDWDVSGLSQHAVEVLVPRLPPVEQYVITERFGLNGGNLKTYAEIGKSVGRDRERIRQIQNNGLRRMRGWFLMPTRLRGFEARKMPLPPTEDLFPNVKPHHKKKRRKRQANKINRAYEYQELPQWMLPDRPTQERNCTYLNVKDGVIRIPYANVVKFLGRGRHLAEQIVKAIDRAGYARISSGVYVKILRDGTEQTIRTCDNTEDRTKFFIVISRRGYDSRHLLGDAFQLGNLNTYA